MTTPQPAQPVYAVRLYLAALPSAAYWARHYARDVLMQWGINGDVVDSAQLVTTKLINNAIADETRADGPLGPAGLAGAEQIAFDLHRLPDRIRIAVYDSKPAPPQVLDAGPADESNRDMKIISSLCMRWRVQIDDSGYGKWVVADIRT